MTIQALKPGKKIRTPFLKMFPQKYQKLLLKGARIQRFKKGAFVFRDCEKATRFYLILSGKVNLLAEQQDVRFDTEVSSVIFHTLCKGDVVGWSWLITPYRWRFDAVAAEDCELLAIDGINVRAQMAKNHSFAYEIYKRLVPVMNQRLIAARLKLQTFGGEIFAEAEGG